MKFCCGVTLYYPSEDELSSILKYSKKFEKIYLYDNTDATVQANENKKLFESDSRIEYIGFKSNDGLSVAFNTMCNKAISGGFDFICLFDQDSIINNSDLENVMNYIIADKDENVGLYAPEIVYAHKNQRDELNYDKIQGIETKWAISSGSFVSLRAFQVVGGFDENYFIDRLDYDYCYRLKKIDKKVITIKGVYLYQSLGEMRKVLFKNVSQHSPLRHYYMFRNRLYFYLKVHEKSILVYLKVLVLSCSHFLKILFYEESKVKKISIIFKAYKDFLCNQFGKLRKAELI